MPLRSRAFPLAVSLGVLACAGAARAADPAPSPVASEARASAAPNGAPGDGAKPKEKEPEKPLPPSVARLSRYERDTVALALGREDFDGVDPEPEGKIVEAIQIVRLDVLEARDPVPKFARRPLNALHTTTKERIVQRELLLKEGEPFRQVNLDETERNLRRLPQITVAIGLALRSKTPGKVRILVMTKDVWSLRLNYDLSLPGSPRFEGTARGVAVASVVGPPGYLASFSGTSAGIETLVIKPSETNLAGQHHTASLLFSYKPESLALGVGYSIPRFGTSLVGATASASVVLNNRTTEPEGSAASLSVGQSLYTTRTEWAWSGAASYSNAVTRRYSNAKLLRVGASTVPADKRVPFEYRARSASANAGFTRSFGWAVKNDVSLTAGVTTRSFSTFDLAPYDRRSVDTFLKFVPRDDTRVGPGATYHTYTTRFHRITDFETLALQEDYRLGHDTYLQAYPVLEGLGSSRTFLGLYASTQYTVPLGNGLARASFETFAELDGNQIYDAAIDLRLRIVTPRFGIGRLVFDAGMYDRLRNYLRSSSSLGGDTRLRGFPTGAFLGEDSVVYNVEFRTRPIHLWSLALGGAVFYDAGDAFDGFRNLRPKQSTGVGFRLLIPQFNRVVFRGDLGFPLTRPLPAGSSAVAFFFGFEQAFAFGSAGPN